MITSLGQAFCKQRSRNNIAKRSLCRVVHPFPFARRANVPNAKVQDADCENECVRQAAHDECQDRRETRYRKLGTCRSITIKSLTYLHNNTMI